MKNLCLNKFFLDFSINLELVLVVLSNFFMGIFGKVFRRFYLDVYLSFGQLLDCQLRVFYLKVYFFLDLDFGLEEDGKERIDFQEDNYICIFKQILENYRILNFQLYDLDIQIE